MRKLGIDAVETEAVDEGVERKVVRGEKLEFVQYSRKHCSCFDRNCNLVPVILYKQDEYRSQ